MSDRPPSSIADARDKDSDRCCENPQVRVDPVTGELHCENCGTVQPDSSGLIDGPGFGPDIWREHRRLQARLLKLENFIASSQSLKCREIINGKQCGRPIFRSGRGPAPKRCKECEKRRNRDKVAAWREKKPEAWLEIRERYEVRKNPGCAAAIHQKYAAKRKLTHAER